MGLRPAHRIKSILRKRKHEDSESGVILLEFALVAPLLCLLLMGALEFGYLISHNISVANATGTAARAGAATTSAVISDDVILEQVSSRKLSLLGVQHVVVYKASGVDGKPTPGCLAGNPEPGACNVYKLGANGAFFGSAAAWPAVDRTPGVDYLGVLIVGKHPWLTNVFGAPLSIQDSGVILIEPISVADEKSDSGKDGPSWNTGSNDPWGDDKAALPAPSTAPPNTAPPSTTSTTAAPKPTTTTIPSTSGTTIAPKVTPTTNPAPATTQAPKPATTTTSRPPATTSTTTRNTQSPPVICFFTFCEGGERSGDGTGGGTVPTA